MSFLQSPISFLLGGFLYRLLGNRVWTVKGVCSCCNTLKSKCCYGNNNVKVRFYSLLSFDIYCMYLFSVTENFICYFQLEKVLQQGDIGECADPYIKEEKVKHF